MGKGAERRRRQKERRRNEHGELAHQEAVKRRAYKAGLITQVKERYAKLIDPLGMTDDLRLVDVRTINPKKPDPADKIAARTPTVYYVIVGRGPAAICNHTTLRQSAAGKARIGALPVLHVGFPDPWKSYFAHGMGQPPHLLGLPGFEEPPGTIEDARLHRGRCHSEDFAAATEHEWQRLAGSFPARTAVVEGAVMWVQKGTDPLVNDSQGKAPFADLEADYADVIRDLRALFADPYPASLKQADAPYRVAVVLPDGRSGLVYAKYVDFCSGAGRPSPLVPRGNGAAIVDDVDKMRAPPWIPAAKYWAGKPAPLMSGNEALLREISWPKDRRVACYGAGGVGLNMVERAEDEVIALDWISEKSLLGNGMLLTGNVPVLRERGGADEAMKATDALAARVAAAAPPDADIAEKERLERLVGPFGRSVRFIRQAPLQKVRVSPDQSIVGLDYSSRKAARCVDSWEVQGEGQPLLEATGGAVTPRHYAAFSVNYAQGAGATLNAETYGRLIWTIGQEGNSSGNPKAAAGHLGFAALTQGGLVVGLSAEAGAVRVLGAGAQAYPGNLMGIPPAANAVPNATQEYFLSLPVSAVPPGFIYSGACIAMANGYFTSTAPNPNVNTMTKAELESILGEAGASNASELARLVLIERRKLNGFGDVDEFWRVVVDKALGTEKGTITTRKDEIALVERVFAEYPESKGDIPAT